jgi:hypothetical protein
VGLDDVCQELWLMLLEYDHGRKRCFVGEQTRSAQLPLHQNWWVVRVSRAQRRSFLIAEELERLAVSRERDDAAAIRGFLVAWRRATQGRNPMNLELEVKRARANMAIVFAHCPHIGSVPWLPVLVVPWNHRLGRRADQ